MSSIEEKVIAEIRERAKKGEAKYGTTMDRDDLSLLQWLQHLKEELTMPFRSEFCAMDFDKVVEPRT